MPIDMAQFHQTFFEESFEGLDLMESGLLDLNAGDADIDLINTIFRAAHSIKGGSATFGFKLIPEFTHIMETLLDEMRDKRRQVTEESVNVLLQSVDCLRDMLASERDGSHLDLDRVKQHQEMLQKIFNDKELSPVSVVSNGSRERNDQEPGISGWRIKFLPFKNLLSKGNDPVRMFRELSLLGDFKVTVDTSRLPAFFSLVPEECDLCWELILKGDVTKESVHEIFEWVEDDCELDILPLSSEMSAGGMAEKSDPASADEKEKKEGSRIPEDIRKDVSRVGEKRNTQPSSENSSIRVGIDKIDGLINMVGELVIIQSMLAQLGKDFDMNQLGKLRDGLSQLERNTRELQENVMRIRMLPISFAFNRFPRMVHDLSQKMGKEIELKMSGENTELDKTVMEKIVDPLVHLVRNSVDHGIEMPEVRRENGKPETGLLHLNAYHKGGNIVIEISDDGAGLNKEKILRKARERGLVKEDEVVSEEGINDLIFLPGFSTAEIVSDVSGRGVGMDVVKRNIHALGGKIEVVSSEGKGTSFIIRLPLTLAILDGQLVSAGDQIYIIPLVSIIESLQITESNVNLIAGKAEVYKLRDEYIPIIRLYDVFNIPPRNTDLKGGLLVVVEGDGKKAGVLVDDLLDQQQVVIKSLETNFKRVEGVSGATILGDGTVALIMDVSSLIRLSHQAGSINSRPLTFFANSKAA
ncbi:MAG: chemotaxis protein CheA [Gammaproteobacteria bacterium]|nr:chemotaxis protein CheA [Gammaproteobacteria bacterium]